MDSTLGQHQTYLSHPTWRNRLGSFLLAAAATLLMALLMLAMGAMDLRDKSKIAHLIAVEFSPNAATHPQKARAAAKHSPAPPRTQPPVPQPRVVKPPVPTTSLLRMSKEEYAATDISNLPKHAEASGDNTAGNSSSTFGPGEGPGGVHLYNAEWYREPTRAELATYLSQTSGEGEWAMIACKTIEHYHVENCQELDESPPGSGLARALRQAAWQFLVRPPRVDGHILIGSWVRIRFTFTKPLAHEPVDALPGADEGR